MVARLLISITVRAFTYTPSIAYNGPMKMLYTAPEVQRRIEEMAQEIIITQRANKPLFVCLLKGAVPFTSQLMMAITRQDPTFHPEVVYMHASAYGTAQTAGEVSVYSSIDSTAIAGRSVIVLDDCLDKGVTYTAIRKILLAEHAASVELIVLVNKQVERSNVDEPRMSGFSTPDVWLIGMGLDDADTAPEAERWAGYIADVTPPSK